MEAIDDLMGHAWPVSWRNDLASSFYNRALAKMHATNRSAAGADVAVCLAIQHPLVAALGPRCPPAYRAVLDVALGVQEDLSGHSVPGSEGASQPPPAVPVGVQAYRGDGSSDEIPANGSE